MSFYSQIHDAVATLVMFYEPDDRNSQEMLEVIDDLKSKITGSAQILTVNVDEDVRTAEREKIKVVPSFAIYRYGVCHWRDEGIVPEQELLERLEASADPDPADQLGHHHTHHVQ